MNALFDAYVAVDWSARSVPCTGRDSIWYCTAQDEPRNPRTRDEATRDLRRLLHEAVAHGRRVLVGFDFPLGYPRGFADLVARGRRPAWRRVWDVLATRIRDDGQNANNRFEVAAGLNGGTLGPFWGCPEARASAALSRTRRCSFPYRGLAELRAADRRASGLQSPWKLYGAGSVGSQALLGIPRVASLRDDPLVRDRSAVWPFETGFRPPDAPIVFVETWPSLVRRAPHPVRDAGQVLAVAAHWRRLDADGALAPLFSPSAAPAGAESEEGWIFG